MSDFNLKTVSDTMKMRTCYLAAPTNVDLKTIEELLLERQMQLILSADLSSTASTFLEGLVNAISNADLFIAVLSPEQTNDQIYIELGIAIAKERRILILAPLEVSLTLDIAEIPAIRTDATNRDAISFMLDQVLEAPLKRYRPHLAESVIQKGQPIGNLANEFLEKLDDLGEYGREDEIEQLIALALEKSGYSIIARNPLLSGGKYGKRPDLIVWSDEFGPWIGNPLIIEVKRTLKRKSDCVGAVQQVLSYLQLSQTRSALIMYVNKIPPLDDFNLSSISPPNIFFLDVHEFLTAIRTKSFARIMVDLRNRRVHGTEDL